MAQLVLSNQKIWMDGYDMTGVHNAVAINYGSEAVDDTTFGDVSRSSIGGLKTVEFSSSGLVDDEAYLDLLHTNVGIQGKPLSVGLQSGTEGDRCVFFQSIQTQYNRGGAIGDMNAFDVAAFTNDKLISGIIGVNSTKTSTGNGTARQLGAVAADKKLYAAIHVLGAVSGSDSIVIKVQSDDNSGFTSATDRITFDSFSAIGSQFSSVAGAITDDYWRFQWTITGSAPSFPIVCVFGII